MCSPTTSSYLLMWFVWRLHKGADYTSLIAHRLHFWWQANVCFQVALSCEKNNTHVYMYKMHLRGGKEGWINHVQCAGVPKPSINLGVQIILFVWQRHCEWQPILPAVFTCSYWELWYANPKCTACSLCRRVYALQLVWELTVVFLWAPTQKANVWELSWKTNTCSDTNSNTKLAVFWFCLMLQCDC